MTKKSGIVAITLAVITIIVVFPTVANRVVPEEFNQVNVMAMEHSEKQPNTKSNKTTKNTYEYKQDARRNLLFAMESAWASIIGMFLIAIIVISKKVYHILH